MIFIYKNRAILTNDTGHVVKINPINQSLYLSVLWDCFVVKCKKGHISAGVQMGFRQLLFPAFSTACATRATCAAFYEKKIRITAGKYGWGRFYKLSPAPSADSPTVQCVSML